MMYDRETLESAALMAALMAREPEFEGTDVGRVARLAVALAVAPLNHLPLGASPAAGDSYAD